MVELTATRFESAAPDATPLLIAHGVLGQSRNWAGMARRFAATRPVMTLDMRNHGDSPWAEPMDYAAMASDLIDAVDRCAGGRALLLGHSMGGKAAMAAALTAPERVAALVVADIAPVAYADHDHAPLVQALRAVDLSGVERRAEVEAQLLMAAPEPALRAFVMQNLAIEEEGGARRARWRPNLAALEAAMPDLLGWPTALAAMRYAGPALFIHGGASAYVGAAGRAAIAAAFPAAERITLDGAGHWLHAEQPDAFLRAVDDWLAGLG